MTSGNLWIDVDSERRVHYDWVTNVREVSPWSLSYHVMVHEAEEEELHSPSLECAKIAGLLTYFTAQAQLRFERHPSVHKLFLNMWGERNHSRQDNARSFCQPSCNQISCYSVL